MENDTTKKRLRIVVKIGTSSLFHSTDQNETSFNLVSMAKLVETINEISHGHEVVVVASGAVGCGAHRFGLSKPPDRSEIARRQALASVGQVHLMSKFEMLFSTVQRRIAQVLVTYENFIDRVQFTNIKNTFEELFKLGAIPIVNENDTVGIHELKHDNDRLSSMVANLIHADLLFLMTDVNGVYTANPNIDPNAERIPFVSDFDELRKACKLGNGDDSEWGTGGMAAKICGASLSTSLGVKTVIMNASDCPRIVEYVQDECAELSEREYPFGTTFERNNCPPQERKRWIRSLLKRGVITVDDGAAKALGRRKNLFAVGVRKVEGEFCEMEAVTVVDLAGNEIAYGLCNFASDELDNLKGLHSEEIDDICGVSGVIIARENMDVQIEHVPIPRTTSPSSE